MLVDRFDAFFLDLDGVVYIGQNALPHTIPSLQKLRSLGKHIRFLTNNPCHPREYLVERLNNMGIEAYKDEMMTASWATCLYLQQQGIKRVYVPSSPKMELELAEVGITIDEDEPEAVVIACHHQINYESIRRAALMIRRGANFIATMVDAWYPSAEGPAPSAGSIVAAIEKASEQRAIAIGKPYPAMFLEARRGLENIDSRRIVMIGDTPTSDILGAHQAGFSAILIAKKAPDTQLFPNIRDLRQPDAIMPDLGALFDEQYTIRNWQPVTYRWPHRTLPAVAAIITNEVGQVLLIQSINSGRWQLPTGAIEPGETIEEAIKREVRAVTGLSVQIQHLSGVYSQPATQIIEQADGEVIHFITSTFLCTLEECESDTDDSYKPLTTVEVKWANSTQLPESFLSAHRRWLNDALSHNEAAIID